MDRLRQEVTHRKAAIRQHKKALAVAARTLEELEAQCARLGIRLIHVPRTGAEE